jgi:hypothetical protein
MKRELTDVDLITYRDLSRQLEPFFVEMGYVPDKRFIAYFGGNRLKYLDEVNRRNLDVFLDKLEMCHTIDFKERLELDCPTITLADFLLEKMQIVQLNEKDIKDTIVLLREHDVGNTEAESINARYLGKLMAQDWGFYYTFTTNLKKVKDSLERYPILSEDDRKDVSSKIDKILDYIEREPKSMAWKMRARVGSKKKWYKDVEETVR